MRSVAEAQQIIIDQAQPLAPEIVSVSSAFVGQTLAEDVASDIDSPPYAKALMDGYAVRFEDLTLLPRELEIIEEIAAGQLPTKTLGAGEAARIFTGAAIPTGCTAVIQHEVVEKLSDEKIRIRLAIQAEQFILPRGREMQKGRVVLRTGDRLRPESFGILSAVGRTSFLAYPRPQVSIIATGNELVEPNAPIQPGQIRNTNGPMLVAQVLRGGGKPQYLGIAEDRREVLRSLIRQGLETADVLLLAGGVSEGKFDLVPSVLEEIGVNKEFHKVAMKPGKPLFFGTWEKKFVFGLPGNPVSSFVCFELFVRPALRKLRGERSPLPTTVRLALTDQFSSDNNRPTFFPARSQFNLDGLQVEPLPWFGSADLAGIHGVNALLALPPGKLDFPAGHQIETILLDMD